MKDKTKNNGQFPRLYTIHSQKGGVGKTSIAIAIAGFAAIVHGKKALIIDADMTGVSLYDIPGWSHGKDPHYLNEILLASPLRYESILDKNERGNNDKALCNYFHNVPSCENIKYIPASPCINDITCVVPLISQEDFHRFFRYRLEDIIAAAINSHFFEVIVIDNSPGLFGISKSTLKISFDGPFKHASLHKELKTQAIIVTSTDPPDYLSLFPSLSNILLDSLNGRRYPFVLILNKIMASEGQRDEVFLYGQLLDELSKKSFTDGRELDPEFIKVVKASLTETGGLAAPHVEGFNIDSILQTIKSIKSTSSASGNFGRWCEEIGKACGLWPAGKGLVSE